MKISSQLASGFTAIILLYLVSSVFSLHTLSDARSSTHDLVDIRMRKIVLANDAGTALRNMLVQVRNMALFSESDAIDNESLRFATSRSAYLEAVSGMEVLIQSEGDSEEKNLLKIVRENDQKTLSLLDEAAARAKRKQLGGLADYLTNIVRPPQQILVGSLNDLASLQISRARQLADANAERTRNAFIVSSLITCLSVALAVCICIFIIRLLYRQLGGEPREAQKLATVIAGGELTTEITLRAGDRSSLMASLSGMQENLRKIVFSIKETSVSVAQSAVEISNGNLELSSRTEEQAAALQQTAASMEEISATVKSNSEGATHTAKVAREAALTASAGRDDVMRMAGKMSEISSSASRVREITGVIESIAFQTNILALNAAVEAARAGEEGRGFAVVAGEVRTLAQRSANAARDIKTLIEQAVMQVEEGVNVAEEAGKNIYLMADRVGHLVLEMDVISLASAEQMQGISQISQAVSEMDGLTQSNAALVEESSVASQSLSSQAGALKELVENFRV